MAWNWGKCWSFRGTASSHHCQITPHLLCICRHKIGHKSDGCKQSSSILVVYPSKALFAINFSSLFVREKPGVRHGHGAMSHRVWQNRLWWSLPASLVYLLPLAVLPRKAWLKRATLQVGSGARSQWEPFPAVCSWIRQSLFHTLDSLPLLPSGTALLCCFSSVFTTSSCEDYKDAQFHLVYNFS